MEVIRITDLNFRVGSCANMLINWNQM